ncbi:hypothetical protein ADMFC3_09610 [Geovibrio sp. ADMFC3]
MNDLENEKFLNAIEFLSSYVSNELNNGKKQAEVIDSLVNKMGIERALATKIVTKNDGFKEKMYIFSKEYIRKDISLYIVKSVFVYTVLFIILYFLGNYEQYVLFAKYLLVIFLGSFIVSGISLLITEKIIMNRINIILNVFVSLSSFLLGALLVCFIRWDMIEKIYSTGALKTRFLISIVNFIIDIGPVKTGALLLFTSIVYAGIAWNFYYDIKVNKLNERAG